MKLKYFNRGFNYSQDGPGNRLVYHLQGCNMRCPWCSNPEGMDINGSAAEKDIGEVINDILSCRPMFFDGGGVTFTGGEASLQLDAIKEIMRAVKAENVSAAVETNGTSPRLKELLDLCDCWIMDFKSPDSAQLHKTTGMGNETIRENIGYISRRAMVHIRIPLIHGFNDDGDSLHGFTEFFKYLSENGGSFDIELLAYHEFGKEKWEKQQKKYEITDGFVSQATLNAFKNEFENNGFTVIHT